MASIWGNYLRARESAYFKVEQEAAVQVRLCPRACVVFALQGTLIKLVYVPGLIKSMFIIETGEKR